MLILVAMLGIVIFGAAALAVDLSIQTHDRRTLQNWTDTAALAGARDLPGTTSTAQVSAPTAMTFCDASHFAAASVIPGSPLL